MLCTRFRNGEQRSATPKQALPDRAEQTSTPPTGRTRLYTYHVTARKRKILIVDDDEGIRASLGLLLKPWGFETLQASDAAEATRLVDRHDPDIVITDLVMPEVSGLDLLRK